METTEKIIIYQVFTRLFGNQNKTCRPNGSLEENGCGKMNDFTKQALHEIKKIRCYAHLVHRTDSTCFANGLYRIRHSQKPSFHCERESRLSVCHPRLL